MARIAAVDPAAAEGKTKTLFDAVEKKLGVVPNLLHPPPGCRFADRCAYVLPACRPAKPPRLEVAPGHHVLCQETVIREFAAP